MNISPNFVPSIFVRRWVMDIAQKARGDADRKEREEQEVVDDIDILVCFKNIMNPVLDIKQRALDLELRSQANAKLIGKLTELNLPNFMERLKEIAQRSVIDACVHGFNIFFQKIDLIESNLLVLVKNAINPKTSVTTVRRETLELLNSVRRTKSTILSQEKEMLKIQIQIRQFLIGERFKLDHQESDRLELDALENEIRQLDFQALELRNRNRAKIKKLGEIVMVISCLFAFCHRQRFRRTGIPANEQIFQRLARSMFKTSLIVIAHRIKIRKSES